MRTASCSLVLHQRVVVGAGQRNRRCRRGIMRAARKSRAAWLVSVLTLLVLSAVWVGSRRQAPSVVTPAVIGIATGMSHQTYHAVGEGLAALINERVNDAEPGKRLRAIAVVTGG